ncbi:hypothetical protein CHKEEEPN_1504 [Methylorubrum podarium]|nr:hypothetical protein CHKEEEPN_1504 [Methylorubrum podarium]
MPPIRSEADELFSISTLPFSLASKAPLPLRSSAKTAMRPAPAVKAPIVTTWTCLSTAPTPAMLPSLL